MVLLGAAFGVLCVIDGDLRQDRSRWCGFRLCYAKRYQLSTHINPFYLHGDFDGDGRSDSALLIKERSSGKNGIAIYHGKSNRFSIVGAGQDWGNGSDNFPGMDAWHVFHRGPVGRGAVGKVPPKLRGDALMVIKTESGSALIYWNGKRYAWYQQGD